PRYKKLCFPDMTIEEILLPVRQKINQQTPLSVPKKISSFYQKLKHSSQQAQIIDDEVQKYWLFAEADETIKLLDWWNTHTIFYIVKLTVVFLDLYPNTSSKDLRSM
ncbi:1526_t:CDS:2, partial [Dentiscutata heterogama]